MASGKLHLHAVADAHSSRAFGFLHPSKRPEAAVAALHDDAPPFHAEKGLSIGAALADNGREVRGTDRRPCELYLDLADIEHRRTKVRRPQTNGVVERCNRTVLDEFFRVVMRETCYETVEAMQTDLDAWLVFYNTERPHLGCRNQGRRPLETLNQFVSAEG